MGFDDAINGPSVIMESESNVTEENIIESLWIKCCCTTVKLSITVSWNFAFSLSVFMIRLGLAIIGTISVWMFGSLCQCGLCWLVLEVSDQPRNPAFSHSPYGLSSVSCVLTFRHSFSSCPILPQVKHHPTNCSYMNATQTLSPFELTTSPPLHRGLSNGILTLTLRKWAFSDLEALQFMSINFPNPRLIS